MPTKPTTKSTKRNQVLAANARKAKEKLPPGFMKKKAAERKAKMGEIDRSKVYPQAKLMQLAGWGALAWKRAVDSGLEFRQHGHQVYVTGEAYFRWVEGDKSAVDPAPDPS